MLSGKMVPDNPNPLDLLPDRHPQSDFFICDVADAVLKDLTPTMEHPFYALSKKPVKDSIRYTHRDAWIEVVPSSKGQATIYDKDVLIYVVSQIMSKLNAKEPVSRTIRFNPRDFLIFANRGTGGRDYDAFEDALDRLMGTFIKTNIITRTTNESGDVPVGEDEITGRFHLLESAFTHRKTPAKERKKGRVMWAEIKISEWVFNSIRRHSVLTLHRDYFRLRKPMDRRVYEIARKLCGAKKEQEIGLEKLFKRTGTQGLLKRFRHSIKQLAASDHLPDYSVVYDEERDMVIFKGRGTVVSSSSLTEEPPTLPPLSAETFAAAKRAAPGWDVYVLEGEWRAWTKEPPRNADAAFIGFCKKIFKERGRP